MKIDKDSKAEATVINASVRSKDGRSIDLIVHKGELKLNDYYVVGDSYGKVRTIHDGPTSLPFIPAGTYGRVLFFLLINYN